MPNKTETMKHLTKEEIDHALRLRKPRKMVEYLLGMPMNTTIKEITRNFRITLKRHPNV